MKYKKLTKKDLEFIDWKISDIKKIPGAYKEYKQEVYKKIKSIKPEDRTFDNTVLALEYSDGEYAQIVTQIETARLMGIGSKKFQGTLIEVEKEIQKNSVDLEFDKDIYDSLMEYVNKGEKLVGPDKKLLADYVKGYERMGFSLPLAKQRQLKVLNKKLLKLVSDFSKNITDHKDSITLSKDQLGGLSSNFVETLKRDKKGNYIVSLDYPELGPFVEESEVTEKRKELIDKNSKKGGRKNLNILNKVLSLRKEKATLLGYKNHAEYAIDARMADGSDTVIKFITDLRNKVQKYAEADIKEILDRKIKETGNAKDRLNYYDSTYFIGKIEKEKYNLDPELIREYFPLDHVLENMLKIFGDLYGIDFKKKKTVLWHNDAKMYALVDRKTKDEIAFIAMDLFPREGKYGHACAIPWRDGREDSVKNQYVAPITSFICNFRKPSDKTPSLISPYEITTMFHEFGHAMHNSLTKAKYPSQSGFNVMWDFVELPSQLAENWFYDPKSLKKVSCHYKTGKSLPKKDIDNILRSKNFLVALGTLRQLNMGILDMTLHTKGSKSPEKLWAKMSKESTGISIPKDSLFPASFNHIISEYDAGYYSYLWSLVYADDVFSEFKKHGIFSKKIGMKYRKEILEVGGSRDEMESLKAFLGRKPNNKAFIKNILGK